MPNRRSSDVVAAALALSLSVAAAARAENAMDYRLLSQQEATSLPQNGGSLGLNVVRAQHINDGGMTFDIIRVTNVRNGSPGAQGGIVVGDQIIAVDGRVFASLTAFAAYVGSKPPETPVSVDYIPAGGGPSQAQRVALTIGVAGAAPPVPDQAPAPSGMSTSMKVAIGVGAVALLGCYEMGCFSHRQPSRIAQPPVQPRNPQPSGAGQQQQNDVLPR